MRHEESKIQQACVMWFSYQYPEYRYVFGNSSNGVCTSVIQARILKAEGLLVGEADIHLYVARQGFHGLFVEMKTATGRQSDNQKTFEKAVTEQGYKYCVCRSFDGFMTTINDYLGEKADIADAYQDLFDHMSHEHGSILTHHELDEIIRLSKEIK